MLVYQRVYSSHHQHLQHPFVSLSFYQHFSLSGARITWLARTYHDQLPSCLPSSCHSSPEDQLVTLNIWPIALLLCDHPGILMDFTKKNGDLMGFEWYLE